MPKSKTFDYFTKITVATLSVNKIVSVSIALKFSMFKKSGKSKKTSYILLATIWRVFRMIVVKIICLHFRIDGHHLFRSIPLASRELHRSQSVDEPVSQISHGNFTIFLQLRSKSVSKFSSIFSIITLNWLEKLYTVNFYWNKTK